MFFHNVYYVRVIDAYTIAFLERSHVDQPTVHHVFDRCLALPIPLRCILYLAISPNLAK